MEDDSKTNDKVETKRGIGRFVLLLVLLVIVIASGAAAFYYKELKGLDKNVSGIAQSPSPTQEVSSTPSDKIKDDGVTWIQPVKLDDLGLFESSGNEYSVYSKTDYYKVGEIDNDGEIILASVSLDQPSTNTDVHRIIRRGDNFTRIARNSDELSENYSTSGNLNSDEDFVFQSLLVDDLIVKGLTKLVKANGWSLYFDDDSEVASQRQLSKVTQTKWGDLMLVKYKNIDGGSVSQVATYAIKLNDSTEVSYKPMPSFLRDDYTLNVTWADLTKENNKYQQVQSGGCGLGSSAFPLIVDDNGVASLKEIAKSSSGDKILSSDDSSNTIIKYGYEMYQMGREGGAIKDMGEFISATGIIVWEDDYGNNIGYVNMDYAPQVECGKPVVYLYPTEETEVAVKVGANITVSEPEYGQGWKGLAKPSGEIMVDGKSYHNLFWEGLGWGSYPIIKSGTIIKTADARATITSQLKSMSLNDREIADFLEFWMVKMPKNEYMRISWIYGEEMNKLAPLQVTPKPDSVIRVFMDFVGLDKSIEIKDQVLPKFERKGFTVVEWGGLLVK